MSLAIVHTRAQRGISAPAVAVEVHLSGGLPSFSIVGMPETGVKESRERVRSALLNSGFDFPARRITVNLAPADLPKEGGRYDLAIAVGILSASGQLPETSVDNFEFLAELALSGELRPVRGVLPVARQCQQAGRGLWLAKENLQEAALVSELPLYSTATLLQLCQQLGGAVPLVQACCEAEVTADYSVADLKDVRGQHQAKRALEIAAGGGHNLLII